MLLPELLTYFDTSDDGVDGQVTHYPNSSRYLLRLVTDDFYGANIHVIESITIIDADPDEDEMEVTIAFTIAHCENSVTRVANDHFPILVYEHLI